MKTCLIIILTLLITGCFYSHTQYRPTTESNGAHTQRESLFINKHDYQLSISSHIDDDYFLVQVSAEKSKITVHVDIENINLKSLETGQTYKPINHSYWNWAYNKGGVATNEKDISKSVLIIKFSSEAINSKELSLYLPFNNKPAEHIKFTKESVILPMTIN